MLSYGRRGLRVQKSSFRSPNTVRQELLVYFMVFGERHLTHLCSVFVDFLLSSKQPRKKKLTRASQPPTVLPLADIRCEQRLGGLLKHYYRKWPERLGCAAHFVRPILVAAVGTDDTILVPTGVICRALDPRSWRLKRWRSTVEESQKTKGRTIRPAPDGSAPRCHVNRPVSV